jgi:hypothetical protein
LSPAEQTAANPFPSDWGFQGILSGYLLNEQGLTTGGIWGNTSEGKIEILGTGGHTYYYGFGLNVPLGTSGDLSDGCVEGTTLASEGGGYQSSWIFSNAGAPLGSVGGNSVFVSGLGVDASISIFVNAQEDLHKKWFGTVSGSEKNHLVYYTGTFGCSGDGNYPIYTGP